MDSIRKGLQATGTFIGGEWEPVRPGSPFVTNRTWAGKLLGSDASLRDKCHRSPGVLGSHDPQWFGGLPCTYCGAR